MINNFFGLRKDKRNNLTKEWLLRAKKEGFALGAFNFVNLEMLQAMVKAAEQSASPIMIQASCGAIDYAGIDYIMSLVAAAKKNATIPVFLHLDHGDYEHAILAIKAGFDSIMFDGSMLSDEENTKITSQITRLAHAKNIQVEAEIGRVGGVEEHINVAEGDARYTTVTEAINFVNATGVDSLAIAIGTAHGVYHGVPILQFDLIKEIATALPQTALVMHGSSGISETDLKKAIAAGIDKINIDTDLRLAFTQTVKNKLNNEANLIDLRKYLGAGRDAVTAVVTEKMAIFGSQNLAKKEPKSN